MVSDTIFRAVPAGGVVKGCGEEGWGQGAFGPVVGRETGRWKPVAKDANIQMDQVLRLDRQKHASRGTGH